MNDSYDSEVSCIVASPFGRLRLTVKNGAVTRLTWTGAAETPKTAHPLLSDTVQQLEEYFAGTRRDFDVPLAPAGSDFQKAVCRAISQIPFGQTRTYGDLARDLGVAAQPIGQGCGGNPIPILIPCHRVMAADGKLGGFSGGRGAESKLALLRHEGAILI